MTAEFKVFYRTQSEDGITQIRATTVPAVSDFHARFAVLAAYNAQLNTKISAQDMDKVIVAVHSTVWEDVENDHSNVSEEHRAE